MKKISKLFCLLLSSFLITGCVAVNPYVSASSIASSSSEASKTDWTDSEKSLMSEHLYGVTLPFFELEGLTLRYDAYDNAVVGSGASTTTGIEMANYANRYRQLSEWKEVGSGLEPNAAYNSYFAFEKTIALNNKKRYVRVEFYCLRNNNYSSIGEFHLMASDPFEYTFPTAKINNVFDELELSKFSLLNNIAF